ncbi:hypothetical protein [Streptomyces sp. CB01580]|uniref:hypothetical protein n=1 Tax=Streptomyces sp. CB01580 TaxID=1703933 RepID=UPI00093BD4B8|nr:hypothetical protein [Streptomyces sp. CB01580]OKJ42308.1 hypothetical protein AMK22_05205 [Streptomyces sp. CB01580]
MRRATTIPAAIAVMAGLTVGAHILILHRAHQWATPAAGQLADAHAAGYRMALDHVSRGLFTAPMEEP